MFVRFFRPLTRAFLFRALAAPTLAPGATFFCPLTRAWLRKNVEVEGRRLGSGGGNEKRLLVTSLELRT